MLEQSSPDGNVVLEVPPVGVARGVVFLVPIRDLQHGTSVLLGNTSDFDTEIVVRYGNNAQQPPHPLRRHDTMVIDVTVPNTLMRIVSTNPDGLCIAQLAVDTGKTTTMTFLTPTSAQ